MNETFEKHLEPSESASRNATSIDLTNRTDEPKTVPVTEKALPEHSAPLFSAAESQEFRSRWDTAQTSFVDEPRKSVEDVDNLVAAVIKRLSEIFANERTKLEGQWDGGGNVSTEDLRLALQRYRSFFSRLLSV